jgi:ABC-type multidrug transport system fused ATPase/permease subunit
VYLFGIAQQRIIRGLRLNLYQAILRQDISFFDTTKTGEITSRLTADSAEMANDLTSVFRFTIESLVRIGGIIAYMFVRSWRMGLLALAIIPLTSMINRVYAKFMHQNQEKVQTALAEANSVAQEAIGAIRTVCSFAMENGEYARYESRIDTYYTLIVRQYFISGVYYMICNTFLINTVVQASLLAYGAHLIRADLLQATVLLSFMLYQAQLQEYFQNLFNSFTSLIKSSGAAAKVFDYIDRRPRYRKSRDLESMKPQNFSALSVSSDAHNNAPSIPLSRGHVSLHDVHFCYPSRPGKVVLRGFSLNVEPASCVALVGLSGSGKSTVFSLIEHFYEVQQGIIRIDGVDVADMAHSELHRVVAMVGQEPELMSGTIESNIMYGTNFVSVTETQMSIGSSTTSNMDDNLRQRMISAAKDANAFDFIMNELPDGFQTEVGERGVQLSGGQKQRIAIARCLMQNPCVLLLDEATSALDSESEAAVQEALTRAMVGRTTIVIAHRLSTIKNADIIVVLNKGQVMEQGTHDTLMSMDGTYRRLVERQLLLAKVES